MTYRTATAGKFITLEGGEGAGKSTHARDLARHLEAQGLPVTLTREPGGSPGAEEIRQLLVSGAAGRWAPLTETLLHSAARAEHIARTIDPALAAGQWVVCDRYIDSTIAYQGYGLGLGLDLVGTINRIVAGARPPDLTLILDLPVEQGLIRAGRRGEDSATGEDRYERMDTAFHRRVRDGFLEIARAAPDRCIVIDASAPVEAVTAAIRDAVSERLVGRGG